MRIGLISDTHDRLPVIVEALVYFHAQHVDLVIHCGDWKSMDTVRFFAEEAAKRSLPTRGVLGNNDLQVDDFLGYAQSAPGDFALYDGVYELPVDNRKYVGAYHGHHKPTFRRLLHDERYEIILLGHSHKPEVIYQDNKLIVNPGSTAFSIPRSKTWRPSIAIVNTDNSSAEIVYF